MGRHFGTFFGLQSGDSDERLRALIRRNRKKILFALGLGVILAITAIAAVVVFFFTTVLQRGSDLAQQVERSGYVRDVAAPFINWVQQAIDNTDFIQWLTLFLQFNN